MSDIRCRPEYVGRVRKQGSRYTVWCAACGKGLAAPIPDGGNRSGAMESLRSLGWTDVDKYWRCPRCSKAQGHSK